MPAVEHRLVTHWASEALNRILRRVIRGLQPPREGLQSGEDSGLTNTWDEICVQVQGEQSVFWDAYLETMRMFIETELSHTSRAELEAMWLQTDRGSEWVMAATDTAAVPVSDDDVLEDILASLRDKAADWSNERIRRFLER